MFLFFTLLDHVFVIMHFGIKNTDFLEAKSNNKSTLKKKSYSSLCCLMQLFLYT